MADREQAGGLVPAAGISEGVKWRGMARHWDGKNRKDLEEEGRDRNRVEI